MGLEMIDEGKITEKVLSWTDDIINNEVQDYFKHVHLNSKRYKKGRNR
jgi:hypothetical protein